MGLATTFIGGALGTSVHVLTNGVMKIPYSRKPWLHVGYFFLGGYAAHKWLALEEKILDDINEIRADKGMPPMVGSGYWLKYQKPEGGL
mmetsp:Transcript_11853/g.16374  ORF Transcript_11853/g.16374 Transcript_11853/m.16374 type:complete len:89 (+) Transcript_11853:120-386(+)